MPIQALLPRFQAAAIGLAFLSGLISATPSWAEPLKELRIGYQKYGTLVLLKASGSLEKRLAAKGVAVKWTEFSGGVRLLEGLNVGSIDVGTTGDAPPVVAQAAGTPLVYVGYEPPSPKGEALLVHADSPLGRPEDLKGKKVSVNKGGNVHYLLIRILEKAGLKLSDVEIAYLPPADARPAFERKSIDAWVIWDPHLANVESAGGVRVLADGNYAGVNNTQFYLATRKLAEENPDVVSILLEEIGAIDAHAQKNLDEAAAALAKEIGLEQGSVKLALSRMGYGVRPIDGKVLDEQQILADRFYEAGLIPNPIKVHTAVAAPQAVAK